MVGANLNILDQIARFFILLSDAPSYWFSISSLQSSARESGGGADNVKNTTLLVNDEHNNTQNDGGDWQRQWAVAFDSGVGIWRRGSSGENGVWQQRQRVIRAGTQLSINDPLRWMMTRRRGQREGECNNQIEVEYVRGEWAVDNTTRGGGGRREASRRRTMRQEGGGGM
jgi:hypothetical protein